MQQALAQQNAVTDTSFFETASDRVQLRVSGQFEGVQDIVDFPIRAGGRTIKLGDIANVHSAEATRQAGELHATLHYGRMDDIFEAGLHPWLERFLARINRLGDSIGQNFLVPVAA